MKILIGFHQRSGSTLLQHILNSHSKVSAYSELDSVLVLPLILGGYPLPQVMAIKPWDGFFLRRPKLFYRRFDKFIWLARDPRDTYLSEMEKGYTFGAKFWMRDKEIHGVNVGLLKRWKQIYQTYFRNRDRWHLVRYEDLATNPEPTLQALFAYLDLPYEKVYPFKKYNVLKGGDDKLAKTRTIHKKSVSRFKEQMAPKQIRVFKKFLGNEMRELQYI
mgnify:CR=1 FL=1